MTVRACFICWYRSRAWLSQSKYQNLWLSIYQVYIYIFIHDQSPRPLNIATGYWPSQRVKYSILAKKYHVAPYICRCRVHFILYFIEKKNYTFIYKATFSKQYIPFSFYFLYMKLFILYNFAIKSMREKIKICKLKSVYILLFVLEIFF